MRLTPIEKIIEDIQYSGRVLILHGSKFQYVGSIWRVPLVESMRKRVIFWTHCFQALILKSYAFLF